MSYPTWLNDILPCPETGDRLQYNGNNQSPSPPPASTNAGHRLRQLQIERGLSIRTLAKQSGLNVNTLSMDENNKTSPSVSALQQVATALKKPITTFFGTETLQRRIVSKKQIIIRQSLSATVLLQIWEAGFPCSVWNHSS
ncbi:MAG: helix-turn-helix transcriptional regulator [Anaerolineales bacterium]